MKQNYNCTLERAIGLFYDKHLTFTQRTGRITDAYFGGCVDYASEVTARMIDERFEREHESIRLSYCHKYNTGIAPENPRYNCDG